MFAGYLADGQHVLLRIKGAARISRVAYENGFRPVGDGFFEKLYVRNLEPFPDVGRNRFQRDAVHECEGIVIRIERFEYDDFIAFVAGYFQSHVHAFASCHGYDKLRNLYVYADTFIIFVHEPFAKLHQSCGIGIGYIFESDVPYRIQGAVRRFYIWLPDIQVIDFHSLLLRCV